MKLIKNIELTDTGVAKFVTFFNNYAKAGVDGKATLFDLFDVLQERAAIGDDFVYELHSQYTNTGREELLTLDPEDVSVTGEEEALIKNMKLKLSGVTKLITLARTQTALAEQLGLSPEAIQQWVAKGYVPQKRIADVINLYPQLTAQELIKQK